MLNHMSHHMVSPSLVLKTVTGPQPRVLLHPGVGVHALELPLDLVLEGLLLDPTIAWCPRSIAFRWFIT